MSHIGKQPINIDSSVEFTIDGRDVAVKGPKGTLSWTLPKGIGIEQNDGVVTIKMLRDKKDLVKFYGLSRSLVANMVIGVTKGFEKKLEMVGVGYRSKVDGRNLVLSVGYSHPVKIVPPEGITFRLDEGIIVVEGIDKQVVGDIASKIRAVRKPEPYKGKGIKYVGEKIRRKAGKAAKSA